MKNKELIPTLEKSIERIGFLLSEWIEDYSFFEKPDPNSAIEWARNQREDLQSKNSAKWFWEYNRIHDLVDMAIDYVRIAEEAIEEAKGVE